MKSTPMRKIAGKTLMLFALASATLAEPPRAEASGGDDGTMLVPGGRKVIESVVSPLRDSDAEFAASLNRALLWSAVRGGAPTPTYESELLSAMAGIAREVNAREGLPLSLRVDTPLVRRQVIQVLGAMGYDASFGRRDRLSVENAEGSAAATRRRAASLLGLRAESIVAAIEESGSATLALALEKVPAFMPRALLSKIVGRPVDDLDAFAIVVSDPRIGLLVDGLRRLPSPSRDSIGEEDLLALGEDRAAPFWAMASTLHLGPGGCDPPGGPAGEPLWQDLVGTSPREGIRFVHALLDATHRDAWRLWVALSSAPTERATRWIEALSLNREPHLLAALVETTSAPTGRGRFDGAGAIIRGLDPDEAMPILEALARRTPQGGHGRMPASSVVAIARLGREVPGLTKEPETIEALLSLGANASEALVALEGIVIGTTDDLVRYASAAWFVGEPRSSARNTRASVALSFQSGLVLLRVAHQLDSADSASLAEAFSEWIAIHDTPAMTPSVPFRQAIWLQGFASRLSQEGGTRDPGRDSIEKALVHELVDDRPAFVFEFQGLGFRLPSASERRQALATLLVTQRTPPPEALVHVAREFLSLFTPDADENPRRAELARAALGAFLSFEPPALDFPYDAICARWISDGPLHESATIEARRSLTESLLTSGNAAAFEEYFAHLVRRWFVAFVYGLVLDARSPSPLWDATSTARHSAHRVLDPVRRSGNPEDGAWQTVAPYGKQREGCFNAPFGSATEIPLAAARWLALGSFAGKGPNVEPPAREGRFLEWLLQEPTKRSDKAEALHVLDGESSADSLLRAQYESLFARVNALVEARGLPRELVPEAMFAALDDLAAGPRADSERDHEAWTSWVNSLNDSDLERWMRHCVLSGRFLLAP